MRNRDQRFAVMVRQACGRGGGRQRDHRWLRSLLVIGTLTVALVVLPAAAQAPASGELIVHYDQVLAIGFTFAYIAVLSPTGSARNITGGVPGEGDILLAPNGNLYVASSLAPIISIYSPTFTLIGQIFPPAPARFLAMDANGLLYAGTLTGDVNRYTAGGTFVDTFSVGLDAGDEIAAGDLGRDQCTLYYFAVTSDPRVRRYDVCRRQQLADLGGASVCVGTFAPRASLRVANDGAVLVAGCVEALRFTSQGVRTYPLPSIAIAPTADGRFFWTGHSTLSMVDVETGAVVAGPIPLPTSGPVTGLEIAGAGRASLNAEVTTIPMLSLPLLGLLGLILGALGIVAVRGT